LAEKLARLGIHTVQDLLFHLPSRYQDRTRITPIGAARLGAEVVVVGQIEHTGIAYGRRRSMLCRISDGTGSLTMRLFHFSASQQERLVSGRWLRCFGEVRRGPATLEMVHPEYEVTGQKPELDTSEGLTPIYPATEGIGQGQLRRMTGESLRCSLDRVVELLPESVLSALDYPTLKTALRYVHRPPLSADTERLQAGTDPAQQRLAFEELLAHHLSLRLARQQRQAHPAPAMREDNGLLDAFWGELNFVATHAQQKACAEILEDLRKPIPMLRLLQGDVGSGKTVVAGAAVTRVLDNRYQAAVMAPTELLSEQHYRTFSRWFDPLDTRVGWLSSRVSGRQRRQLLDALSTGEIHVVIGTHALFQQGVEFQRLGLIVVDEQHRFGVDQRLALRDKGTTSDSVPHQLVMTATPIPRTLAMTFYADLDVSSIEELPPGRQPVETVVVREARRGEVVARVEAACRQGRQAYWVCPIIDESEVLEVQAATEMEAALKQSLPNLRIGLVHGRMKAQHKEAVMERFRNGEVDLLVATTVIEVGVDVPQASLMVIENAERLGLAQLHQLRGRVGRGSDQACCVLMYRPPLGDHAKTRLATLRDTTDGFEIARKDLELRGPGEVLGTRQTGLMNLMIADLVRDQGLLPKVEQIGRVLLNEHPRNIRALISRWVGHGESYVNV
jgi:ATP-dependent DNA helicase RecG